MCSSSNCTVKNSRSNFLDPRTLLHTSNINSIHGGLDECVEAGQRFIVGHGKNKMCLEELVIGSNYGLRRTGNDLLVQDNVEILDAVASFSNTQEKGLSTASFPEEGLHASPHLRKKEQMNHVEYHLNVVLSASTAA